MALICPCSHSKTLPFWERGRGMSLILSHCIDHIWAILRFRLLPPDNIRPFRLRSLSGFRLSTQKKYSLFIIHWKNPFFFAYVKKKQYLCSRFWKWKCVYAHAAMVESVDTKDLDSKHLSLWVNENGQIRILLMRYNQVCHTPKY